MKARDLDIEKWKHWFTVQDFLDYVEKHNIDKNAPILVQRVEDFYYEKMNWPTVKKEGEAYNQALRMNRKVEHGEFDNKESYPDLTHEEIEDLYTDELALDQLKEEYSPIHCPVIYKNDNKLYLDLHY